MTFLIGKETAVFAETAGFARKALEILRSEHVVIYMYGNEDVRRIFEYFTSPHKKMPLVPNKFFGAALIRLPETPQAYLQGGAFEIARQSVGKRSRPDSCFGEFARLIS